MSAYSNTTGALLLMPLVLVLVGVVRVVVVLLLLGGCRTQSVGVQLACNIASYGIKI